MYTCLKVGLFKQKSRSIQADANKVSLMLKNWNGWKWFCDFEDVWRWFKNTIEVKAYILLTESNSVKYLGVKIHAKIVLATSC